MKVLLYFLTVDVLLKEASHDCCWSGKSINHFQNQGKIHMQQIKQQNPNKLLQL